MSLKKYKNLFSRSFFFLREKQSSTKIPPPSSTAIKFNIFISSIITFFFPKSQLVDLYMSSQERSFANSHLLSSMSMFKNATMINKLITCYHSFRQLTTKHHSFQFSINGSDSQHSVNFRHERHFDTFNTRKIR